MHLDLSVECLVLLTLLEVVDDLMKMLVGIVCFGDCRPSVCSFASLRVVCVQMTCCRPHLPVVVEVVDLLVLESVQQLSVELAEKEALRHHPPAD